MFSHQLPTTSPEWLGSRAWRLSPRPPILMVADRRKLTSVGEPDPVVETLARIQRTDATYAAKVARVRRYQARLRSQLSRRGWQLYLKLEEAEVDRWGYAVDRIAKWASRRRVKRR